MRYIHSTLPLSLHTLLTVAISFITRVKSAVPPGYTTPNFPSLYWPLPIGASRSFYLYEPGDIVRFTVYWTLILVGGIHLIVALWAYNTMAQLEADMDCAGAVCHYWRD
jgi:hypothetical protein